MPEIKIAPSILSADFGKLNEEIATVEAHSDYIHVDVMDGHFVPNITLGPPIVKRIKSDLPLDVHLMIENPEDYIEAFVEAGADIISVHVETCPHLHRVIQQIKSHGIKASVAVNPGTPVDSVYDVINDLDQVLLMTVNPGFGGQKFIESVLPKIKQLREYAPEIDIEVDGGINAQTVQLAKEAGANVFVAGSYIFKSNDRVKAIESLRG